MSELHENKNLELDKNENESRETTMSYVAPRRDILFYIKSDYADLADEHSKKIKRTYDFLSFAYGKSNTERLSKIIDEAVKKDMEFVKGKTDKEITDWQKEENPNYQFENSLYARMRQRGGMDLFELILWHMTLLDILNLKCCDLNLNEPLEKSIENAMTQKSSNRLDFLCGNHGLNFNYITDYSKTLYEYSKQIFEDLPKVQRLDLQTGSLMGKIFACFVKVAFCKMKSSAGLECYKNDQQSCKNYRLVTCGLKNCFYLNDDYHNGVKATEEDMAAYLFLTGELDAMFESHGDFLNFFGYDTTAGHGYGGPSFGKFLFFLNEIKPLEKRYDENKARFIKMFFPGDTWDIFELHCQVSGILYYFQNKELGSSLVLDLKKKFKLADSEKQEIEEPLKYFGLKSNWGSENYFRDIIERFAGDEYSNLLVEGMSAMLCRNDSDIIDNQKNDQEKENNDNKLIENSNIIKSADNIVQEEKEKNEPAGTKQKKEDQAVTPIKETVENKNLKEDEKRNPIKINQIKLKKNKQAMTEVKNETENNPQNWFVRFVYKVINFFRSIGSRIRSLFCGQPNKIDIVDLKNDSIVQDINNLKGKDSGTPKANTLSNEEQKNII